MSVGRKDSQLKDGLKCAEGAMGERTPSSRSIGQESAHLKDGLEGADGVMGERTPSSRAALIPCSEKCARSDGREDAYLKEYWATGCPPQGWARERPS